METRNSPFSCNNEEEDRISKLPDTLIHHLHMKYAIQTSVLSTRWRYLWTSLPTLDIKSYLFRGPDDFNDIVDFVDRVLMVRESCDIQRFYLHLNTPTNFEDYDITDRVHTWVLAAVRRNVQDLSFKISLWVCQVFQFPHCLFTCESLTKLELSLGSMLESELVIPKSMDLPMLKYLKLSGVTIKDEKFIDKLLSSCPVLESLIISRCCLNLSNIYSLKLKHFKLKYCDPYLCGSKSKTIKLYAPNLTSFICKSYMLFDYALENLSSLVTADILLMVEDEEKSENLQTYSELSAETKESYAKNMINFLRGLLTVKDLILSTLFLEVISEAPNLLESQPFLFCNLRWLELRTFLSRDCFRVITYLLKISPNLESLYMIISKNRIKKCGDGPLLYPFCDEIEFNSPIIGDDWEAGLSSPCMLYHLKSVKIIGVKGGLNELKFLEILLKNAMVLEKVVLYCKWKGSGDVARRRMKDFSEKLVTVPRASSSVAFMLF